MSNRAKTDRESTGVIGNTSTSQRWTKIMRQHEEKLSGKSNRKKAAEREQKLRANTVELPGQIIDETPNPNDLTPSKKRR